MMVAAAEAWDTKMRTLLLLCLLFGLTGCKPYFERGQIVRVKLDGQRGQIMICNRVGDCYVMFPKAGGGYINQYFRVEQLEAEKP